MVETCEYCGRTYLNADDYHEHSCITTEDTDHAANHRECHEEVSRRGELQPCDLPAVAVRIDARFNLPYPVCKRHTRGPMVPLHSVYEAIRWAALFPPAPTESEGTP